MSIKAGKYMLAGPLPPHADVEGARFGIVAGGHEWQTSMEVVPPPDPHQALKDAVVAEAIAFRLGDMQVSGVDFMAATDALLAAQRPPSKYAGLRKALETICLVATTRGLDEANAELAKLEAEERERG